MDTEILLLILPTATMVVTGVGIVAMRSGLVRYALLTLAALLLIAILFITPHWAEAGDLFILWRLMIMAVLGAATLMIMAGCIVYGAAIAGAILLVSWIITRKGTPIPTWVLALICLVICVSIGQMLDF